VLAYQYADTLVSFYSMKVAFKAAGADVGDLPVWQRFADPKVIVLTANTTTIYTMSFLDLDKKGPMVVEVQPGNVYGAFFDLWQVPIGAITQKGGTFVIASDNFEGTAPAGATLIKSRTGLAALFARGLVVNNDVDAAARILETIKVYPLSQIASPPRTKVVHVTGVPMDTISPEGMPFWERTAESINAIPADDDGSLLLTLLKPLGIEQGKPFKPDPRQTKILEDAAQVGWLMSQAVGMAPRLKDITYYPGTQWEWLLELDTSLRHAFWRDLEARINYFFQAVMPAPALKEKAIGTGSQYLRSARDANGEWLDGAHQYRLRVPANPPAELFWSVTVYDYQTRSQIQTDTNKTAVSSYDKLKKNDDGSVYVYFGPTPPAGMESNWVKTIPGRGWWVLFRFFSPTAAFFDKSWKLPDFDKMQLN
jgi:hypothetical protein